MEGETCGKDTGNQLLWFGRLSTASAVGAAAVDVTHGSGRILSCFKTLSAAVYIQNN